MSLHIQSAIKKNHEELQDYLRELKNWEKDITNQEMKLLEKRDDQEKEKTPPLRRKNSVTNKLLHANKTVSKTKDKEEKKPMRISSYDYAAWDKFDVDQALKSDSEEEDEKTFYDHDAELPNNNEVPEKSPTPIQSKEERADKLKEEGNVCYAKGAYSEAIAKYTQGIGLRPNNPLLPANRAMAYIKLKKFKAAEKDCTRAIKLDSKYIKAYLRRATALTHMSKSTDAKKDYEMVLKLEPWNKDALRELEKLNRLTCDAELLPRAATKTDVDIYLKKFKMEEALIKKKDSVQEKDSLASDEPVKPLTQISKKPLVRIPVVEVDSKEEMEAQLIPKKVTEQKRIYSSESVGVEFSNKQKELGQPELPRVPRTSHQFSQDWRRVCRFEDIAQAYLRNIPHRFFRDTEFEVEQLVEIFNTLCSDRAEVNEAASIMEALTKSRGFYLNLAFLEEDQKQVLRRIVSKIENCTFITIDIKLLKDVC